jgi:hypothetical protein
MTNIYCIIKNEERKSLKKNLFKDKKDIDSSKIIKEKKHKNNSK